MDSTGLQEHVGEFNIVLGQVCVGSGVDLGSAFQVGMGLGTATAGLRVGVCGGVAELLQRRGRV